MVKQRGAISTGLIVALAAIAFIVFIGLIGFSSYVSAYNYGNTQENLLEAKQDANKNILAQYGQKLQEAAQVPAMYRDDLTKVLTADVQGRYGKDGSKATMQWFKEHEVHLDANLYEKIQQIVEAGRNDFEHGQKEQLDIRRAYKDQIGSFWRGMWLKFAGYPKEDLSKYDIVSTDRADTAFKNRREDGPIDLIHH
jgi:hypothetical protein